MKAEIPLRIRNFLRLSAQIQLLPALESGEETLVGGQAVMEGVMMRAPHSYCVSVRKPDGTIVSEERPIHRMSEKYPIFKYPVFRGLGTLAQAMQLGTKALHFSSSVALDDGSEPAPQTSSTVTWAMGIFSAAVFIFLYKFVPLFLATRLAGSVHAFSGRFATNIADGVIRMAIFLGFLLLMSTWKDFRRVWEYHGAEHKVVFNYESRKPVNVENAQKFVTFHPRCGTSFLLVLMVIAMIVYALIPVDGFVAKLAARIGMLPIIVGLSYELIRFAAKRQGTLMGLLSTPGLWLQRVTTKPPDNEQVAVAIDALERAMALEEKQGGELVIA
jgi:uncharacterized protein YqhQ